MYIINDNLYTHFAIAFSLRVIIMPNSTLREFFANFSIPNKQKPRKHMLTGFFRYNNYYCSSLTYGNNAI